MTQRFSFQGVLSVNDDGVKSNGFSEEDIRAYIANSIVDRKLGDELLELAVLAVDKNAGADVS